MTQAVKPRDDRLEPIVVLAGADIWTRVIITKVVRTLPLQGEFLSQRQYYGMISVELQMMDAL